MQHNLRQIQTPSFPPISPSFFPSPPPIYTTELQKPTLGTFSKAPLPNPYPSPRKPHRVKFPSAPKLILKNPAPFVKITSRQFLPYISVFSTFLIGSVQIQKGGSTMKWGIPILVILALLVAPANLFATEEWEQKLMDEGWENVTLENWADTTWYGQIMDVRRKDYDFIRYIFQDGKNWIIMNKTIGSKSTARKLRWELKEDGKICSVIVDRDKPAYGPICGKTIWKKKNSYIIVTPLGTVLSKWRIEKGNLENF